MTRDKTKEPVLYHDLEKDRYINTEDYYDEATGIKVPAGFQCDHASIPRFLWAIIDPHDLSDGAPLVHDWINKNAGKAIEVFDISYRGDEIIAVFMEMRKFTRKGGDKEFNKSMRAKHVRHWKRHAAYHAVRFFGWKAWNEHLRKNGFLPRKKSLTQMVESFIKKVA